MRIFGLKGISLCLVLLMVLVLLSMSGEAFSVSLPPHAQLETLPYLPADSTSADGIVTGSSGAAMAGPFWTKSVFQSLRNESDWDIYLTQAWNENPTRITSNVANDTQPNLNRGTTRVAFVSDRNDNNEIYTMNTIGKDVRRLTYTEGDEYYPVWSPDSNRIAFYANRNNSIDIYVMNADGSNQTRLTYTGLNRYPHWSPDGSQLVFAAYRNGQYGIWIMNANGSNPHQIGNPQPYMQHPLWSWDGQYILYDADSDGDGFNEICVMNADGTQQRTLVNGGTNEELWANSWMYIDTPGVSQIAFTRLQLIQYEGNWYWQWAHVETQPLTCGWGCYPERLTDSDLDWAISNQTSDITPPLAWFKPLPEYSRYSDVNLEWEQRDDLSGSPHYQQWLQVRENGGVWTDWARGADLDYMPTVYSGTSGSEVAFRIRIGDPSSNWNQWTPEQYVPHTKLYAHNLSGVIRDSRGLPIPHGEVIVSLPVVGPVIMEPDGRFALRLEQGGDTQVNVEATGYGIVPEWSGTIETDTSLEFRLPPGDEVVQNGRFEGDLNPWIPAGDALPIIITDTQRPDSRAVFLRAQVGVELGDPVVVSSGISLTNITDSALDTSGGVHLLSIRQDGLYYVRRNPARVWENVEKITSDAAESAAIAVSQDGKVHVIWWGFWPSSSSLFYCERYVSGAWSQPLLLDDGYGGDIAVDGFGGVHLAYGHPWDAYTISGFYQHRTPEGIWQESLNLAMAGNGVSLAVGETNNVHMIFRHGIASNYCVNMFPYTVPDCRGISDLDGDNLKAVVDNTDTMHLISGLGYYSAVGNNPRPAELLPNTERGMLAIDAWQNLYAVGINGDHVYLSYKPAGLEWMSPEVIGEYSGLFTHILSDAVGNLVIGYMQSMYEPVVRDSLPGNAKVSVLSQALVIPADMTKPTLSFDYRLAGTGYFSVTLVSTQTTTLFSTTANVNNWTHAWVDVSPWVGKSVTVTFAAIVQTPATELRLYLDDVSLGSWMTPVPQTIHPRVVEAHRVTPITILGENFFEGAQVYAGNTLLSSSWISDTQMAVIVPLSLTMGLHPLRIVNPGGQTGYAPQALQVGTTTYVPILLKDPPWIQ